MFTPPQLAIIGRAVALDLDGEADAAVWLLKVETETRALVKAIDADAARKG